MAGSYGTKHLLEHGSLRHRGLWGFGASVLFFRHDNVFVYSFQKVHTYILIDFAVVDDRFRFPSIENIDIHDVPSSRKAIFIAGVGVAMLRGGGNSFR